MTGAELCLVLLCCPLGDPNAHPLTPAQFRDLGKQVRLMGLAGDAQQGLTSSVLQSMRCPEALSDQILMLLNREPRLRRYLRSAEARGISLLTRISPHYPTALAAKLRFDAPRTLFCLGDISLLERPAVALVGSRQLRPENEAFARRAGTLAAREGLTLITGGAVGADQVALSACLEAGGTAVVYVADCLTRYTYNASCLYVSADGYDLPFSPARALNRNAFIHAHGAKTLAAQCTLGSGGTWHGCLQNLRRQWSELYVFDDSSDGSAALLARGAAPVQALDSIRALTPRQDSLF